MAKQKHKLPLTPWYPGDTKPIRRGIYQVAYFSTAQPSYCMWCGTHWGPSYNMRNPNALSLAKQASHLWPSTKQTMRWRGVEE